MANDSIATPPPAAEAEPVAYGKNIIERLRGGDLPQMVDWFDPGLLAKVGVRSVISATLGSYTDQRLIQAATDVADEEELKGRYNFSATGNPADVLVPDAGAVWVDYIADLGDGFEATYAMAYLLAPDQLKVAGEANPLPAGRLLIMGGDQVYPDATNQEYQDRLRDPYDWAFTTDEPKRKVFAIPGNHDWYDGLSAFSALFCSARDRISQGKGAQHRRLAMPPAPQLLRDQAAVQLVDLGPRHPARRQSRRQPARLFRPDGRADAARRQHHPVPRRAELAAQELRQHARNQHAGAQAGSQRSAPSSPATGTITAATRRISSARSSSPAAAAARSRTRPTA